MRSAHGILEKFATGLMVGEIVYTHGLRWLPFPSNRLWPGTPFMFGKLHSVEQLADGFKRLVFERGVQLSSYPSGSAGARQEIVYGAACGGNIWATADHERVISVHNPLAIRGPNEATKARVGAGVGHNGRRWMITGGKAYGVAPEEGVNWVPGIVESITERIAPLWYDIQPEAIHGGTLFFDPGLTVGDFYFGSNLLMEKEGGSTLAERRIFGSDPGTFPPDATFGTEAPEYWFEPDFLSFRLSAFSAAGDPGNPHTAARLWFWERGTNLVRIFPGTVDGKTAARVNLETEAATYQDEADEGNVAASFTDGDFSRTFVLYTPGTVEWRRSPVEAESQRLRVTIGAGGMTASFRDAREGDDEAITPVVAAINFPCLVVVEQDADELSVSVLNLPGIGSPVLAGTIAQALDDVDELTHGAVCFASSGTPGVGFGLLSEVTLDVHHIRLSDVASEMSLLRATDFPFDEGDGPGAGWETFQLGGPVEYLTRIRNESAGIDMAAGAAARHRYQRIGERGLLLYAESVGDIIVATYNPPGSPGGGTGRPPRVQPTQINAATAVGDGSSSTTNLGENRLNWRDYVIIHDPEDEFTAEAGDELPFFDWVFADTRETSELHIDYKDGEGDWTTAPRLTRLAEGLELISAPGEGELCVRWKGKPMHVRPGRQAALTNEIRSVLNEMENTWLALPVGGVADRIEGTAVMKYGWTGYQLSPDWDRYALPTGIGWGAYRSTSEPDYPSWFMPSSGQPQDVTFQDATGGEPGIPVTLTNSLSFSKTFEDIIVEDGALVYLQPYRGSVGSGIQFGSFVEVIQLNPIVANIVATFSFDGTAVLPNLCPAWRYGPEALEILEAWAEVRVLEMSASTYDLTLTINQGEAFNLETGSYHYPQIPGTPNADVQELVTTTEQTTASVGMVLLGRLKDSANIVDVNGNVIQRPNNRYEALAFVNAGVLESGVWTRVNVTSMVAALFANRNHENYQLVPSTAPTFPGGSVDALKFFALSQFGSWGSTFELYNPVPVPSEGIPSWRGTATASGTSVQAAAFEIRNIVFRYRLPDVDALLWATGRLEPPMMPAPSP